MLICEKENKIDEFISRLDELEKALGVENSEKEQLIIQNTKEINEALNELYLDIEDYESLR